MEQAQYSKLFSFLWNIANDVLVHAFEKGKYKDIIMPMLVLRRIDVLLEPTKDKVLERKGKNGKITKVAGCSPIREGVLLVRSDTTLADVRKFGEECQRQIGRASCRERV